MIFKKNIYPFYHTISNKKLSYINNLYPLKSVDQFQRELDFFQKNYTNISLIELIDFYKKNNEIPQNNYFHLTFDDGLKESISIISPILKERNLDATFFINPSFINNKEIFYRYKVGLLLEKISDKNLINKFLNFSIHDTNIINQLVEEYEINLDELDIYLNQNDINRLINLGFSIGAHSMNHPYYKDISFQEQLVQTNDSLDYIQNNFNLDYRIFSFPFTDDGVSKLFFESISSDLTFGTAGMKDDIISTNIQRLPMDNCLSNPAIFIKKKKYKFYLQKILNKHIVLH
ncbi:polysaccharide deacetylase family protein [Empedobacter stercoris]|uniref:polysaccharide deacetylase family protein n=1 Tax=Empedobacter stercoris TaxID=1628248 RepID=UPI0021AF889E|nr:polysaccharide deacetylase family protein [Empedobacter stercoris]UWX66425.1 polysaccharide deacetylase family protein [Empedobacter stercoris]